MNPEGSLVRKWCEFCEVVPGDGDLSIPTAAGLKIYSICNGCLEVVKATYPNVVDTTD